MKNKLHLILFCSILLFSFGPKPRPTIYIIGDSTAANKEAKFYPETGWGMKLEELFKDQSVRVENRALNGRSTESFRYDYNSKTREMRNHWTPILDQIKPGDYVFIEFGHNDEKVHKPMTGTSLEKFRANLTAYVEETRAKQAFPVLLAPIVRRNYIDGKLVETHGEYPRISKEVAQALNVPYIDMLDKTKTLVETMGETKSIKLFNHVPAGHENYPKGLQDNTHLSPEGALKFAQCVASGIRELQLPLADFLK